MKVTKDSVKKMLKREWVITNGIGGYAASTMLGANTRKYHGLLVAPFNPPANRYVILSKVDESIEITGKKHDLYTNIGKEYITHGYKNLEEFEKDYLPTYRYKIGKVEIEKTICMEYGKNTVGVYYKIKNGATKAKFTIAPIVNFRDFHTVNNNHEFELRQEERKNKVKLVVDRNSQTPIYMYASDGEYIKHENDIFRNMFYIEEEKRGFTAEENHIVPGVYEIEIKPREEKEISFICSLEENIEPIEVKKLIENEKNRLEKVIEESGLIPDIKAKKLKKQEELIKEYLIAADNFVVYRPSFSLHTLIAGYPWFLDWGRDGLIAFEGLLLIPRRFEIAKEVLKTMIRDVKFGLVPNGYSGFDNRPLYNSVDASLLLFEQIQKYLEYTKDYPFIQKEFYHVLEEIIENYCKGIDVDENNIYLDKDNLIVSGTPEIQNTWMDAKYNGIVVTPRNGKVVEINSLWYNANKIMESLSKKFGHFINAKKYKELATNCQISFKNRFYNEEKKCLYDVLGDGKIRPNQLFALSLTYPILDPTSQEAKDVIATVEKKLLNPYGLKTLAEEEKGYVAVYEGDVEKRDTSYHQGITWPWLLGLYYNALKNQKEAIKDESEKEKQAKKIKRFVNKTTRTFKQELEENGCIGSIAEIYDSVEPQLPKGAFAQAWSIAEVFRIILEK